MELIADGILILAATAAGLYCLVLSRRLRSLSQLDGGLGEAISSMSARVDEMNAALSTAKTSTEQSANQLRIQSEAAEMASQKLEALLKAAENVALASIPQAENTASVGPQPSKSAPNVDLQLVKLDVPEGEPEMSDKQRLDGLISTYLNKFEGEDEAAIASRLVAALTEAEPKAKERA